VNFFDFTNCILFDHNWCPEIPDGPPAVHLGGGKYVYAAWQYSETCLRCGDHRQGRPRVERRSRRL
jgi:hypothetical protein